MDSLFGKGNERDRMLRNLSLKEFGLLAATYKAMFKDQLRQPTADNNHIINYNLKLQNYFILNSSVHMISSGMLTFLVKSLFGNFIDRVTLNYLGQRRQMYAQIFIYVFAFFWTYSTLNNAKRLNVNHLINPRDFNGEIMMNLTLQYYPHKINQERYRRTLMDKYEAQMIKMNSLEQMMGEGGPSQNYYKIANPDAVNNMIQSSATGQPQTQGNQGFLQGNPMMGGGMQPGMLPGMGGGAPTGMPQGMMPPGFPGGMPGGMPPGMMAPQMQKPGSPTPSSGPHAEEQHLKAIIQQTKQQQGQEGTDKKQTEEQKIQQSLQQDRQRIIDQLRDQHQKSPYLSTNPLMSQPATTPQQPAPTSPYVNVSQEISRGSGKMPGQDDSQRYQEAMNNYYIKNVNLPQAQESTGYKYQGHYFNVAQQARKDSS